MVIEEQFKFSSAIKRKVFTVMAIGFGLALIGIIGLNQGWWSQHHGAEHSYGTSVDVGHEVELHTHDVHGQSTNSTHGSDMKM